MTVAHKQRVCVFMRAYMLHFRSANKTKKNFMLLPRVVKSSEKRLTASGKVPEERKPV